MPLFGSLRRVLLASGSRTVIMSVQAGVVVDRLDEEGYLLGIVMMA